MSEHELKGSGKRRDFPTGSRRDVRKNKGRFDLLMRGMARALFRLARLLENGAAKYGDNNWRKGQPLTVYLDSATRHLWHVAQGHEDEDHAIQAAWNCLALAETLEMVREGELPEELNDLYPTREKVTITPAFDPSSLPGQIQQA